MKALVLALLLMPSLGKAFDIPYTSPVTVDGPYYASCTITTSGASATGLTVVAGVAGRTICIIGWSISTDTACKIILHHGFSSILATDGTGNIIGGGWFVAGGGERAVPPVWFPGLAKGQPVTCDIGAAAANFLVAVSYFLK